MAKYKYLSKKPTEGDIVELINDWEQHGRPKGSLAVVQKVVDGRLVKLEPKNGHTGSFHKCHVQVVETLPGYEAQEGDTVIRTDHRRDCTYEQILTVTEGYDSYSHIIGTDDGGINCQRVRVLVRNDRVKNKKPIKKEETKMSTKQKTRLKVFDKKGNPNTVGLIYQAAKFGIIDDRPFVQKLIVNTCDGIIPRGVNKALETALKNCDLVAAGHLQNVQMYLEMKKLPAPLPLDAKVIAAHSMLLAKKAIELENDYTWIKDYLTRENIEAKHVTLYESKKFGIFIESGKVYFNSDDANFSFDIKYDAGTNSFSI